MNKDGFTDFQPIECPMVFPIGRKTSQSKERSEGVGSFMTLCVHLTDKSKLSLLSKHLKVS